MNQIQMLIDKYEDWIKDLSLFELANSTIFNDSNKASNKAKIETYQTVISDLKEISNHD